MAKRKAKVQLGWCPVRKSTGRLITGLFSYGRAAACEKRNENFSPGVRKLYPVVCVELHIRKRASAKDGGE